MAGGDSPPQGASLRAPPALRRSLPGVGRPEDALALLDHLGPAEQVHTTYLIHGETWTFPRRENGHATAPAFLDRIELLDERAKLTVHRVTSGQEDKAWRGHAGTMNTPLVFDATSFRVVRDRRLREALPFDRDFAAAGFLELCP